MKYILFVNGIDAAKVIGEKIAGKVKQEMNMPIKIEEVKDVTKDFYMSDKKEKLMKNRTFIVVDGRFCCASFFTDDGYVHERGEKNCQRQ